MKKSLLATLFLGFILVLAACGSDNSSANETDDTSGADEVAEETEDTGASAEETTPDNNVTVIATDFDLDQDVYTVKAGEEVKITLINEEGHHGISIDEFGVNLQGEGEATFKPEEPGEYTIYCNIFCGEGHALMTATLVVV
ncbi:cupredoxin domain-containing protein [Virgibacillus sp. C22-A2]|uniref:Cupredoxin domain-containing protein n=1 Tax=Virgibacillus tibetensis TaxID=3042313 RepID=A0ABU6KHK0_9BACI|nr:cupredoxin domain-containing protein [Virgibacillus sp. C22-A2]